MSDQKNLLQKIAATLTPDEIQEWTSLILKTAAPAQGLDSEQEAPWWQDPQEIQKLASSGLSAPQLEAVVKEAARQHELNNVFADYDCAGRIMAHGFYTELRKLASVQEGEDEVKQKLALLQRVLKAA